MNKIDSIDNKVNVIGDKINLFLKDSEIYRG